MSKAVQQVKFLVDEVPSGHLATRRKHGRRQTPYPAQMQALIDAGLLTHDCYEDQRQRRGLDAKGGDDAAAGVLAAERPYALRILWDKLMALLGRG